MILKATHKKHVILRRRWEKEFYIIQRKDCFSQAPPEYLLSAAVMSAPAAIAVSKINYPETEESVTKRQEDVKLEKGFVSTNFV